MSEQLVDQLDEVDDPLLPVTESELQVADEEEGWALLVAQRAEGEGA